jgi:hypothetical protein
VCMSYIARCGGLLDDGRRAPGAAMRQPVRRDARPGPVSLPDLAPAARAWRGPRESSVRTRKQDSARAMEVKSSGPRLFGRGRGGKARGWAPALNPHRKHTRQRLSTSHLGYLDPRGTKGRWYFQITILYSFVNATHCKLRIPNLKIRIQANNFDFNPFHLD